MQDGKNIRSLKSNLPDEAVENDSDQLFQQLMQERKMRQAAEERIRKVTADHKRLEIELTRYRDQSEALVASRTTELMASNEKLVKENHERRLAERARRSFEDQFREASLLLETMLDAIPDVIGVQDQNHRIIRMNKAGYQFFGKGEDEVIGQRCFELFDQGAPCDNCVTKKIISTGQPAQLERYLDDKALWMDIRAYPIHDMDGRVFRIVEHWRDITDLKRSEASLLESEEKYRLLIENAYEAIFIFQNGQFNFANRRAKDMARRIGMTTARKPLVEYMHTEDRSKDSDQILKRLNGQIFKAGAVVFRLIDTDGATIWVELNTVNITWQGHPATLNFARDITHQKKLERRFQEAQRMESLGTLAGGIAHDFNNLLMGIQGNVSLLFLELESDPSHAEKLKSIEGCVDSGSRLTKQLLGFARGGKYVVKPRDMNQIIRNAADMFGRTRKAIKIHGNYHKSPWTVVVDSSQIEQVLVNLFLNAWQAMQGTGDLSLATDNVVLDGAFVKPYEVPPGRYVKISVTDSGTGMDESTRRRIFEPFFTTQEPGRGTGLGLASVFGIVKNHNGMITVKSQPNHGSTFEIFLPASDQTPEHETPSPQTIETGTETILLIDDEDYIIDVGRLMLDGLGYTILTANSGKMAVDLFSKQAHSIDLVILDLVMPDMDGKAVLRQLRTLRPDIKVLFATGHYEMEQPTSLLKGGSSDLMHKPFNLRQLSIKIRSLLDG